MLWKKKNSIEHKHKRTNAESSSFDVANVWPFPR